MIRLAFSVNCQAGAGQRLVETTQVCKRPLKSYKCKVLARNLLIDGRERPKRLFNIKSRTVQRAGFGALVETVGNGFISECFSLFLKYSKASVSSFRETARPRYTGKDVEKSNGFEKRWDSETSQLQKFFLNWLRSALPGRHRLRCVTSLSVIWFMRCG